MKRKGLILAGTAAILALGVGVGAVVSSKHTRSGITELSPPQMKTFMETDGTGFVLSTFDRDDRDIFLQQVNDVLGKYGEEGRELNSKHPDFDPYKSVSDYGLNQGPDTLAFYKDGKMKRELDLEKYSKQGLDDLKRELDVFVETVKKTY